MIPILTTPALSSMRCLSVITRLIRARHRLAMTGTPIENRLTELWSLLEFLNPGMLGKASVFGSLIRRLDSPGNTEEREEARRLLARAVRSTLTA